MEERDDYLILLETPGSERRVVEMCRDITKEQAYMKLKHYEEVYRGLPAQLEIWRLVTGNY